MSNTMDLEGPEYAPASGGQPKKIVLLLHGLGADGDDLIGLAPHIAPALPDAIFVSPHAPFPCDMAPYGRQWFSLQERTSAAILAGVQAARPILDAFIDKLLRRFALTDSDLALVGFSQGTMMSLYTAPRRARPIAGVLGYSGALAGAELLAAEARAKPPTMLIHGDSDEIVPAQASQAAKAALAAAGFDVELHIRPGLPHSIDEQGLILGVNFLRKVLGN
jgi:phospholipase/carboxylesterase